MKAGSGATVEDGPGAAMMSEKLRKKRETFVFDFS